MAHARGMPACLGSPKTVRCLPRVLASHARNRFAAMRLKSSFPLLARPDRYAKAVAALFVLLAVILQPHAAEARKTVLIVFDEDKDLPGLAVINRSLREVFAKELRGDVEFYSESLSLSQFKSEGYDNVLSEHFRRKYSGKQPDLIVAVLKPSLDFLLRHGDILFPGVPIVFCGADSADVEPKALRANITGVSVKRRFAPTLDLALKLQPETRNVFVVGGTSGFDRQLQAMARRDLEPYANRVQITYLTELTMDELLKKVTNLPPHSVLYYLTLFADGAGRSFISHEALSRISTAANSPVYGSVDQYIGYGAIGGHVYSLVHHGRRAAEIGVRILHGEAPASIPVIEQSAYTDTFDWRQLERWKLDPVRLPGGSVILFRTPSVWDQYKWYILTGIALIVLQSALIGGLFLNRARLRRAQEAARESERRRRQAEEETQRKRDELAHALRLTTLGELTASFSHELGQPLTAIMANADAVRRLLHADRRPPEDVDEALADIVAAARQAAGTIQGLRNLFRKQETERVPVDLNVLIEDVLRLLRSGIEDKRISVHLARAQALPLVFGDAIQLRQVVLNLLVNAEDAITTAADGHGEIGITTSWSDGHICVAITDNGIGAKESELERMFERFVSSKPQGLGMGLAISRSIVEAHDGRIWATANRERGLTFHVELPAPSAAGADHHKPTPPS